MSAPDERKIVVSNFLQIYDEASPSAVGGVDLEEYQEEGYTPMPDHVLREEDSSEMSYNCRTTISGANIQEVDSWITPWNPKVTFDQCNLVFNYDGQNNSIVGNGAGKAFTDDYELKGHLIPVDTTLAPSLGYMAFFYCKAISGEAFIQVRQSHAESITGAHIKLEPGECCFVSRASNGHFTPLSGSKQFQIWQSGTARIEWAIGFRDQYGGEPYGYPQS